uniref:THAP-type domain-containing protein n=1 Tax=Glossina austeni TaxID=7395 RepID=A0A1A9VI87_GLOAU
MSRMTSFQILMQAARRKSFSTCGNNKNGRYSADQDDSDDSKRLLRKQHSPKNLLKIKNREYQNFSQNTKSTLYFIFEMVKTCIVRKCRNTYSPNVRRAIFKIPQDELKYYLELLRISNVKNKRYYICSDHFDPRYITNFANSSILSRGAIPTLNLDKMDQQLDKMACNTSGNAPLIQMELGNDLNKSSTSKWSMGNLEKVQNTISLENRMQNTTCLENEMQNIPSLENVMQNITSLENEMKIFKNEIEQLRNKIISLQNENASLQKENASLQKENASLQKENSYLQSNLKMYQKDNRREKLT